MEKLLIITIITVLGPILGSFTTMLIYRLHFEKAGILTGRSQCPHCKKKLGIKNLIPIFSWIFQRGKCAFCGKKISFFYPFIELVFLVVFFLFASKFYDTVQLLPILIAVFFTLILFFYDLQYFEVDDRVAYPAIFLAGIWVFFREESWQIFLLGAGFGFSFYALQYYLSRGRWVGAGDMRLGLFMGLVLGFEKLLFALLVAYVVGSLISVWLLLFKNFTRKSQLPMGAFLMPATLLFLHSGFELIDQYWKVIVWIY